MKHFMILSIGLCVFFLFQESCPGVADRGSRGRINSSIEVSESRFGSSDYEVVQRNCADRKCVVIVYCKSDLFTKDGMETVAKILSEQFRSMNVVNVSIFDKKGLAESYAKGTRNMGNLSSERRGWYLRTDEQEFLQYLPDGTAQNEPAIILLSPKSQN